MNATIATLARQLETIVGAENAIAAPQTCAAYTVDGAVPATVVKPASAEEVSEIVRFAGAEKLALIPCGTRSKLHTGMAPSRYDIAVDMTRLDKIAHYDPGDLTLSVDAGIPLAALAAVLAEKKQFLPLAAPYYEQSTVGGTIASGASSLLRPGYGTARDFLIGAEFITGSGALNKSGGRVVKNVTGYDLHKLMIGSLGTLAVITRLNFRTFPLPPVRRGFLAAFEGEQQVFALQRKLRSSPLTPALLEVISPEAAQVLFGAGSPIASLLTGENSWHLWTGFEGTPEVCERYARELPKLAHDCGAHDGLLLREPQHAAMSARLREAIPLLMKSSPQSVLLRFHGLPAELATLVAALRSFAASAWIPNAQVVHGHSEVLLALLPTGREEAIPKQVKYFADSIDSLRGKLNFHASVWRCPSEWKRELAIGEPRGGELALMRRAKRAFDPGNLFAPGRFWGGI